MSLGLGTVLQIITTIMIALIGGVVSAIAWYGRRYVISEVEKNSAVRRWLIGDPSVEGVNDDGAIDDIDSRFDELRTEMEKNHDDLDRKLDRVRVVVERMASVLEENHDVELGRPDGGQPREND